MVKRVVILGPESTGKSTLSAQLAEHFNTVWVREYAREYLILHGSTYNYDDLLLIAQGQVRGEDITLADVQDNGLLFIDTDLHVIKVWCEFVFGKCHSWILKEITRRPYDLYLLCDVDLPWIADELREYPDLKTRKTLFHYFRDILINQPVPWTTISGSYDQRLQTAINCVDELLST